MSILSLKRWEPSSYEADRGAVIRMEVKRLKRHEAKPLTRVLVKVFEKYEASRAAELSNAQKASMVASVYEEIPEDQLKTWFAECVRNVQDLFIDGAAVTTGPELLEIADDQLLFWLLFRLHSLSKLSSAESNASASPSGSASKAEMAAGVSPATSTEGEAGLRPSTVTDIQATPVPSSAPE